MAKITRINVTDTMKHTRKSYPIETWDSRPLPYVDKKDGGSFSSAEQKSLANDLWEKHKSLTATYHSISYLLYMDRQIHSLAQQSKINLL